MFKQHDDEPEWLLMLATGRARSGRGTESTDSLAAGQNATSQLAAKMAGKM